MLEAYYVVETNLRKLPFPQYYVTLHDFADALDANEEFNSKRPPCVPDGAKFRQHVATMKELGIGADRGDTLLKDQRQNARELSELDLDAAVSYLRILAIDKKDPTAMHSSGLPIKDYQQKSLRKAVSAQTTEIHVTVKHLKGVTGGIVIEATHVRNGGPYLVHLCKGDPSLEENWYNPNGHYASCTKIIIRNLEPANRYFVRMRTDGPDGPGSWTQPVSIIVL